jgi:hypothetical protein
MPLCSPPTADCEFFNATSWLLRSPWQQAILFSLSAKKPKNTLPQGFDLRVEKISDNTSAAIR